jgi:hypothetical protein
MGVTTRVVMRRAEKLEVWSTVINRVVRMGGPPPLKLKASGYAVG